MANAFLDGVSSSLDSAVSSTRATTAPFQENSNNNVNRSLTAISASLSIWGTLVIISTYILWKDVRTSSRLILVYISIADFLTASGNLFSLFFPVQSVSDPACKAQSVVTTCSSLWSFFWTTFLAVFLYVSVARRRPNIADNMLPIFHLFGWFVPLAITFVAIYYNVLGDDRDEFSAGWCWIAHDAHYKTFWMLITGKAWEIAGYILISIVYVMLKWHIHQEVKNRYRQFISHESLEVARRAEKKMTFIPIVFILLRMWGTIRFFLHLYDKGHDSAVLVYLQGIGDSGQGFANFMLFCFFTDKFQRRMRRFARRYCRCCQMSSRTSSAPKIPTSTSSSGQKPPVINEATSLLGAAPGRLDSSMKSHP